jgi:methyl-accepting chemotaxis protein
MSPVLTFALILPFVSAGYMLILWLFFKRTLTFKISAALAISLMAVSFISFVLGNRGFGALLWAIPVVGVSFVLTYWGIDRFIGKPLRRTYGLLYEMAEGEGDLSGRLDVFTKDEIGEISSNFNSLVKKLTAIIAGLRTVGAKGAAIGSELASSSEELSATVEQMTRTIEEMSAKIAAQSEEIIRSNSEVQEIKNAIGRLGDLIDDQSGSVTESSAAIEEMLASIKSIESVTASKKAISDQLASLAKEGERGMGSTVSEIDEIARSAQTIFDLARMIDDIAAKTNLLAMNASIEAAHAGAFGKGFAVVAAEIRKLAETTAVNSKNISESLKTIVVKITRTSETTRKTGTAIGQIISGISDLSGGMNETLLGMRELSIGSERITESLSGLVRISGDVRSNSRAMNEMTARAGSSMESVAALGAENKAGMGEIAVGAEEIARAIVSLADLSAQNAENMALLEGEISRFKTERGGVDRVGRVPHPPSAENDRSRSS